MPEERHDAASNAQVAVRWAEREFNTSNLTHGRDQEHGGYSIIVRASEDPLLLVNQLLTMTLTDKFLSDYSADEVALLLDHWEVGNNDEVGGALPARGRHDTGGTRASPEICPRLRTVNWIHGEWRTQPGRLLFHMRGAIAEIERDLIRERVIAGVGRARVQAPASPFRRLYAPKSSFG